MFVCVCNALTEKDFAEARRTCCRAECAEDLFAALDAAPNCRTCIPEVEMRYVEATTTPSHPQPEDHPTA